MLIVSAILLAGCSTLLVLIWRWSTGGRLVLTPFLLFGGYEMVFVWPSTINAQILRERVGLFATLVVALAFIAFLIGFVIAGEALQVRTRVAAFYAQPVRPPTTREGYLLVFLACTVVLFALSAYLYRGLPPLVDAIWAVVGERASLVATVDAFALERFDITKSYYFGGEYRGQGIVITLMQVGSLFLTGFAIASYRLRRTRLRFAVTGLVIVLSVILIGGAGQREQAVQVLVFAMTAAALVGRARLRHVLAGAASILVVSFLLSALNNQVRTLDQAQDPLAYLAESVAARIFLGNGLENLSIIELIDDGRLSFGFGSIHLETLHNALPFVQKLEPFSYRLFTLLHPGVPGTVFETSTYLGMLYADFGIVGTSAVYLLLGGLVAIAQRLLFSMPRDTLATPLIALVSLYIGTISRDNPISMGASIAVALVVYAGMRMLVEGRTRGVAMHFFPRHAGSSAPASVGTGSRW